MQLNDPPRPHLPHLAPHYLSHPRLPWRVVRRVPDEARAGLPREECVAANRTETRADTGV